MTPALASAKNFSKLEMAHGQWSMDKMVSNPKNY